jgi:hypothetical protein
MLNTYFNNEINDKNSNELTIDTSNNEMLYNIKKEMNNDLIQSDRAVLSPEMIKPKNHSISSNSSPSSSSSSSSSSTTSPLNNSNSETNSNVNSTISSQLTTDTTVNTSSSDIQSYHNLQSNYTDQYKNLNLNLNNNNNSYIEMTSTVPNKLSSKRNSFANYTDPSEVVVSSSSCLGLKNNGNYYNNFVWFLFSKLTLINLRFFSF